MTTARAPLLALLAATATGAALLAAGCSSQPLQCTEIGCTSGPTVEFVDSTWQEGDWKIDLLDDEQIVDTCEVTLPADEESGGECVGKFRLALTDDDAGIDTLHARYTSEARNALPSPLGVRLSRDGEQVAEESFEVDYETLRPNGEGCPPTCHQTSVEMTVADSEQ